MDPDPPSPSLFWQERDRKIISRKMNPGAIPLGQFLQQEEVVMWFFSADSNIAIYVSELVACNICYQLKSKERGIFVLETNIQNYDTRDGKD